jgi:hypothetical protein
MCGIGANLGQRTRGYTESVARLKPGSGMFVNFPTAYAVGYFRTPAWGRATFMATVEIRWARRRNAEVLRAKDSAHNDHGWRGSPHNENRVMWGSGKGSSTGRWLSRVCAVFSENLFTSWLKRRQECCYLVCRLCRLSERRRCHRPYRKRIPGQEISPLRSTAGDRRCCGPQNIAS